MKIAYLSQSYPPMISGASIVVSRLARGMVTNGHSVLVIAASDKGCAYKEEIGNLKVHRLESRVNPKRVNQRFAPWPFQEIKYTLQEFEPDIIHTHDLLSIGVAGVRSGRMLNIPVVATIHQLPWFVSAYLPEIPGIKPGFEQTLWVYSRWLNRQCEAIIVPTSTISRFVDVHGGFKTRVVSNGVELGRFNPHPPDPREDSVLKEKYKIKKNSPIILHVGRLDIDKQVDLVLNAAAEVMDKIDAQMLVVGDGECRSSLNNLADNLGISNRCAFLGFIDPSIDLPGIYRMASVFITASEIETQGLVLLEALASGTPVVAVHATCIPEIIHHDINGYLAPPRNTKILADYLFKILTHPPDAQRMGKIGRKMVEQHAVQETIKQHENICKDVITKYKIEKNSRSQKNNLVPSNLIQKIIGRSNG